ncbi:Hit family protein 1 [Dictyocoela muelleri]|nr:Hit family protein 1 [Dictyocoela muelleri]
MDCIFCSIINSKQNILFENNNFIVLLDIYPLSKGHLLVIPKEHKETMDQLSDQYLSEALILIKRIISIAGYKKYNILQNNRHVQSVPHVHFHLIPFNSESECLRPNWNVIFKNDENYNNEYFAKMKDIFKNLEI